MAFWPRICKLQFASPGPSLALAWQNFQVSLQIFQEWFPRPYLISILV